MEVPQSNAQCGFALPTAAVEKQHSKLNMIGSKTPFTLDVPPIAQTQHPSVVGGALPCTAEAVMSLRLHVASIVAAAALAPCQGLVKWRTHLLFLHSTPALSHMSAVPESSPDPMRGKMPCEKGNPRTTQAACKDPCARMGHYPQALLHSQLLRIRCT